MTFRVDDRWLWLGVSVITLLAIKGITYALKDVVYLTEIEPPMNVAKERNEGRPEDSISLETLRTLAESPNFNIANSAISLIVQRVSNSKVPREQLLADLREPTGSLASCQARQAIQFLSGYLDFEIGGGHFSDPSAIANMMTSPRMSSPGFPMPGHSDFQEHFARIERVSRDFEDLSPFSRSPAWQRLNAEQGDISQDLQAQQSQIVLREGQLEQQAQQLAHLRTVLQDMHAEGPNRRHPPAGLNSVSQELDEQLRRLDQHALQLQQQTEDLGRREQHLAQFRSSLRETRTEHQEPERLWRNRHSMVLHEGGGRIGPEDIIRPHP